MIVFPECADYARFMPHWLSIGFFTAIVAALVVIVFWEFKRARNAPYFVPGAVKRYLDTEASRVRSRVPKEIKRGLDAWD
jgi:hypothetical protein